MPVRPRRARLAASLALLLTAVAGLAGCDAARGAASGSRVVVVLGPWTGTEQDGFQAMLHGFERQTGIRVDYMGTRDADTVLASDLKNGSPPDLAVLASPGELAQDAAAGELVPIGSALDLRRMSQQYGPGWLRLMQEPGPGGARHYYAIIVKAALKSVIWYDPRSLPADDRSRLISAGLTWDQLLGLARGLHSATASPWCLGVADSSSSGWPGTDWIEDIVLHQAGPQVYDAWVAGKVPWTSAPIARAWQTFGQVAATPGSVYQGARAALVTSYGRAGQPMFDDPPHCYLDHEASFVTASYAHDRLGGAAAGGAAPRPGTDYDFVPFPALTAAGRGSAEVAGDLLGMFRGTPAARRLIAYLTTPPAQEAWVKLGTGAISVNRLVPLSDYPDLVSRRLARDLLGASSVRFDASDSMPQVLGDAFDNAILEYLDDPAQLPIILRGLDQVRRTAYRPGPPPGR
jgi:alpha-glucoside transport system substrate-binding protein